MPLLLSYSYRNVVARRLTSILTIFGIALVVFVFCAVLMLSHGLETVLVDTGYDDNATVIRKASQTEVQSIVTRDMANIIKADPAIARDAAGFPMATNEILVLISQNKRGTGEMGNIAVRGVTEFSMKVRPDMKLVHGRMWQPGTAEVIAGAKVAKNFQGCGLGETVRFGQREWTIVGVFECRGSGFESEVWGDVDQLMDAFGRPVFSSLTMKLSSPTEFDAVRQRLEGDPRLTVEVKREKEYYREQSLYTTMFINIMGVAISIIFSLGAIVGAMITMYSSVANRTVEIGTLRALGFSRFKVLSAFLIEAVLIALIGGAIGLVAASFLRYLEISTTNWNTFSELAFSFEISAGIAVRSLLFAVIMGIAGGFLPAVRASRLRIINALRAK
jgi:putative ABC transport system permease protein